MPGSSWPPRPRSRWRRGSFASGLAPGQLELDITQSTVLEEDEAMRGRLATLRQLGVRLTIDDFGTGYSSLSHLRRLPVDSVKIDGSSWPPWLTRTRTRP